jgi:hypothetical protein
MNHPLIRMFSSARKFHKSLRGSAVVTFAFLLMVLMMLPAAWAQDNATINGTVADATGAVVPNAQILLTNPATGQVRDAVSSSAGAYRFANVGVGTYTLSASATGFQKYTKTDIVVNVAATLEENISLTVGSQSQSVQVEADALQVQTETSEVSNLISGEQVSELATNGRNVTALAALGLGVSNNLPPFSGVNALTSANGISFNGTRTTHNIYLLDGAEQNDRGCGGCFMNLPSQDAIAEFQTLDSNYSPDYGIGSGGTILMVLKSGTHNFHGELYEFNRNTAYDAADYFSKSVPEFKLNEPGGNIGGPLWIPHVYNENRNRTFFFWNEEWRRLIQGSSPSIQNTILAPNFPTANAPLAYTIPSGGPTPVVPTTSDPAKLALYTADGLTTGSPFPGNIIPANLIDQNAVLEVNAGTFPKPNYNNGTQYIASIPQPTQVREDVVRIDHAINSKYQLMGHYLHDTLHPERTTRRCGATAPIQRWARHDQSVLHGGDQTDADLHAQPAQRNRDPLQRQQDHPHSHQRCRRQTSTSPAGGQLPASSRSPTTQGQRYAGNRSAGQAAGRELERSYYPWKNGYEGFEWPDDLSWTKGRHQFKFGFSWLHDYKNQQLQANTQGTAIFNSSAVFQGLVCQFHARGRQQLYPTQYLYGKHWVNNNYGFYFNDNWHVTPRLTLNLGLRYDGLPHAFERYNQFANFVPADYNAALGNPVTAAGTLNPASLTTFNGTPRSSISTASGKPASMVSPVECPEQIQHLGAENRLCLRPFGDGKTVVRGGFGMFFERVQGNDVYNAALNPPFAYNPPPTTFTSPTRIPAP